MLCITQFIFFKRPCIIHKKRRDEQYPGALLSLSVRISMIFSNRAWVGGKRAWFSPLHKQRITKYFGEIVRYSLSLYLFSPFPPFSRINIYIHVYMYIERAVYLECLGFSKKETEQCKAHSKIHCAHTIFLTYCPGGPASEELHMSHEQWTCCVWRVGLRVAPINFWIILGVRVRKWHTFSTLAFLDNIYCYSLSPTSIS